MYKCMHAHMYLQNEVMTLGLTMLPWRAIDYLTKPQHQA